MRAYIDAYGRLVVEADSGTESYALRNWTEGAKEKNTGEIVLASMEGKKYLGRIANIVEK